MKKLLLVLATIVSYSSYAQKDAAISLTTPASGQAIYPGEPFNISGQFKNTRNVHIDSTDIFCYAIQINGALIKNNLNQVTYYYVKQPPLDSGQTFTFTLPSYGLNFITAIPNANFCVSMKLLVNGTLIDDADVSNNLGCNTVNFVLTHPAGINEAIVAEKVKVYPNPAKDFVNFSLDNTNASSIQVMDITGKLVETILVKGNDTKLDLGNYHNGIYLYQIKTEDGQLIKSGKFNVSK